MTHEPVSTFVVIGVRAHDRFKLKATLSVLQAKIWEAMEAFNDFSHYDAKVIDYEVGLPVKLKDLSLLKAFPDPPEILERCLKEDTARATEAATGAATRARAAAARARDRTAAARTRTRTAAGS